jgi:glutamate synthase domain-containing protein 3
LLRRKYYYRQCFPVMAPPAALNGVAMSALPSVTRATASSRVSATTAASTTNGIVLVLGSRRNFAAGMSGGVACVSTSAEI